MQEKADHSSPRKDRKEAKPGDLSSEIVWIFILLFHSRRLLFSIEFQFFCE